MKGLTLEFKEDGAEINFNKIGDAYELTQQRAVVAFACTTNSDDIYAQKGSDILQKGVTNVIYDIWSAKHEAALISLDILNFIKSNSDVLLDDPLIRVEFIPLIENLQYIKLTTTTEFESGIILTSEPNVIL